MPVSLGVSNKDFSITHLRYLVNALLWLWLSLCSAQTHAVTIEIEGVEQQAVRDNISLLINTMDVEAQPSLDGFWFKQVKDTVAKAVEPFGYYNSSLTATQNDTTVTLNINLGEPLIVANLNLAIIGEGRQSPEFRSVFEAFPLQQGDVLYQPAYEDYKTDMFNYALSHGFFDFAWQATRLDLVRETKQANILLIARSGPQYYFGPVVIVGDDRAKDIIERLRPFKTGDVYTAEQLTAFNRILNETGYFQQVIARPVVKNAVNNQVPIEVRLTHQPTDNFNVGIGFSTDTGLRFPFRWERPWVNRHGHSIVADLNLSEREQEATGKYRIPLNDLANDYATIETRYFSLEDDNRGTESETFEIVGRRFWRIPNSSWQYSVALGYQQENFTQGVAEPESTGLLLPGISFNYLEAKGDINDRQGVMFSTTMEAGRKAVLSDIDLVKATAKLKWAKTIDEHRLFVQTELGAIQTNDFNRVPATMRFFTGGDQSIRGFPFEYLASGDVDENGIFVPRGGRYLATASMEYAYPVADNWRAAAFFDIGTATNNFDDGFDTGIGVGAHWLTLVGPVRFYLAFGRSDLREDGENTIRFHFVLGPAL